MPDEQVTQLDEIVKQLRPKITLFPEADNEKRFIKYSTLKAFIAGESQFWSRHNEGNLSQLAQYFQRVLSQLQSAEGTTDPNQQQQSIQQAVAQANQHNRVLYSDTAQGQFIGRMYGLHSLTGLAAFDYFKRSIANRLEPEYFEGTHWAIQWLRGRELDDLRSTSEAEALAILRGQVEETRSELEAHYGDFTKEILDWKDQTQTSLEGFSGNTKSELQEYLDQKKERFEQDLGKWTKRVTDLEELYQEKLRLEGPAQYWEKLKKEHEEKGSLWRRWAVASGTLLIATIGIFLYSPPGWFLESAKTLSPASIRGSILMVVVISVFIYFIRLFIKLATSRYHLVHDSEERLQLTHLYLALIQAEAMKPEEREIVLQSLFSRAESGLLKGDGSPAFPGPFGSILEWFKK